MEPAQEALKDLAQEVSSEEALAEKSAQALEVTLALVLEVQMERAQEAWKDLAQEVSLEQALAETSAQERGVPLALV